jgi:RND family efflux transporter MFP subunit
MKRLLTIFLPLLVITIGVAASVNLIKTAPRAERELPPERLPTVEVAEITPQDFPVLVRSQGVVEPRTQITLASQVAGRVIEISDSFRNGGFFNRGDLLLRVDPADYATAITVAEAEVARRNLELEEEKARAEQAREEWATLKSRKPTDLHLRKPQILSAQAALAAAEARLQQARLDLQRTRITAPFAGRMLEKRVDAGQFVARGAQLATIYSVDVAEIRLPLTDDQISHLQLPEAYRGETPARGGPEVTIISSNGNASHQWRARVVRAEGEVDRQSRQLFVVAEVTDPYLRRDDRPPLRMGEFVQADIHGDLLESVYAIPRRAVSKGSEVQVVAADGKLYRRQLEVVWKDANYVVASGGIEQGDRLSLTIVPFATDGSDVKIAGEDAAKPKPAKAS